jgi:retron-type reverse transcriptase
VLSRIQRLCGREFQRIGLSATVGNPEDLLEWLAGACAGERQVCIPPPTPATEAEVKLDHVGSLANAAVVISRLHRGEKRLVFVDSRSRAEELGRQLRSLEVATFVTHSSLSQDERRQAEEAFAGRDDCVIVATSVLELGIDVGDLHRVIQIDAPASVARHKGRATDIMNNIRAVATQVRLGNIPMGHVADHLHDWVSDERVLWAAWTYLKQNGGHAAGPDGMRYCDFIDRQAWAECRDLRDEIRAGTYRPGDERVQLIPKASGNGTRPLVIQNLRDRVVQRAVVEVVQPFLDPLFDPRSFGFRPMRGIQDALVLAEHLYVTEQRRVWVTQDLKNAFLKVPLERILDLVRKYLGSEEMTEFIRTVLSGARTPGLRQGGPLSPLLLNVYLHVVLDCRWRQLHPDIPLLRFADDLLLMCRSQAEAERAHADLAELLRPTKMKLKFKVEEATRTLTADQAAEWLGFRIEDGPEGLRIMLAEDALDNLAVNLDDAHHKANAPLRAIKSVEGWLAAMAPCYPFVNRAVVCEQIAEIAGAAAFDEVPGPQELQACWQRAYARWRKMKKKLKRRLLSVDASPVEAHVASDPQNAHTDQEHDDGFIQVERREDGFCQMME